ncbi:MAG: SUMF1/EgtB/PvdO family nonheme iron enzyme [Pyrinomonadaceae bacterium]|nr:SUMF1/EgtB/PvdO family nonheme iron enzyme [Pyrinomonadaceae bacterium]
MRECPNCKLCFNDDVIRCPVDNESTFYSIAGEPILEGKYAIEKRIGQGGMGVVYRAKHNFLKTLHAIKIILPDLLGNDPQLLTRFRQEAVTAASIRHPNIVSVTDFGVVAGKMPFIVMEFVKGESLHDLIVREKRLAPEAVLEILSGICSGVAVAHKQGIVHRDLKPLNVMIQPDKSLSEAVKILDFGLAKIKSGEILGSLVQAQTTGLMGSPYYISPEQWSDEEPDAQSDIYSLGVMLHQMLAGEVPFKGASIPAIMKKHISDPPPPFAQIGVEVSPEIEAVVRHSLEKERSKRTPTVEQMVRELRTAIYGELPVNYISSPKLNISGEISLDSSNSLSRVPTQQIKPVSDDNDSSLPRTSIRVLTSPPQSQVFLDGKPLGTSQANGWLFAENVTRKNHVLRVVKEGFQNYEKEISCDGDACQFIVQLNVASAKDVSTSIIPGTQTNVADSKIGAKSSVAKNAEQLEDSLLNLNPPPINYDGSRSGKTNISEKQANIDLTMPLETQAFGIKSNPEPTSAKPTGRVAENFTSTKFKVNLNEKTPIEELNSRQNKKSLVPIIAAVVGFFLIVSVGGFFIYRMMFPPVTTIVDKPAAVTESGKKPQPTNTPPVTSQPPSMVKIEGGTFLMGRNDGQMESRPAHSVPVKSFFIDKTEVTNIEYADFVAATNHRVPENWVNGKPISDEVQMPVVLVSLDDARDFAKWRSERDKTNYRLPTEAEWEYAARNGSSGNNYPWGNDFSDDKVVTKQTTAQPVGSIKDGANKAGVLDLIGNVWEWTDTQLEWYPNSNGDPGKIRKGDFIIRGGSIKSETKGEKAIDATSRQWVDKNKRDALLGFRLVKNVEGN